VKLWKHHAAQDKADALNRIAADRGEKWLGRYGGKISSEWMIPKIWQTLEEAPQVYENADHFMEAADWVIQQLTGNMACNACTAGYKAIWHKREGYPSQEFFASLKSGLVGVASKLAGNVYPAGQKAGVLTDAAAMLTGLIAGTAIAVANVDAHVSVPAVGITEPGKMLAIIGTSTCHMLLGTEEKTVPGMCGVVEDGIIEGFYGYEAGQSCVGDHFQWFAENCVPQEYHNEAAARNITIHDLLTEKASKLKPGESGLLALDWWNGNRSVLVDVDLTGMLIGANLQTKPEEIYRALIEATAYGTRMIIDTFNENGVPVNEFYAAGGIAEKNAFMMQIYADVIGLPVRISASSQAPALGSAIFAALAAGKAAGGYDQLSDAVDAMVTLPTVVYLPRESAVKVYQKLYNEYRRLHDYFGRGENTVMKTLKSIRKEQKT
jgi:L-ribulokinase